LLSPVLNLYYQFMNIKRYDRFPFYIYPAAKSWISYEDTFITFIDWMVDAHELERNKADNKRTFYQRASYSLENYFRYNNPTFANLMFDTKLRKSEYDKLNAVSSWANTQFYLATSSLHTVSFMYMAYFFRFRRVGLPAAALISSAYYYYFTKVNNIAYKVIVDRKIIAATRQMEQSHHIQPVGHHKRRSLNF
jgi:hypothetical protein